MPQGTATPAASGSGGKDTIFVGGTVLTLDDAKPTVEAIAIRGERILAVGSAAEVGAQADPGARVVQLTGGMTITPGFIDSHQHRIGDQGYSGSGSAPELIDEAIAEGWTSLNELFNDETRLVDLQTLDAAGALRLRVNAYLALHSPQGDSYGNWYSAYAAKSDQSRYLRLAGIKIYMDHGWGIGELIHSQADLDQMVADAHSAGWQIAAHTVGNQAHSSILDALEAAGVAPEDRPRIEHVIAVSEANIGRMRDMGVIASVQFNLPGFAIDGSDWSEAVLPPDHLDMFRYGDLADAGLHVAGSSDWPWITQAAGFNSPMGLLYQAVTRRSAGGRAPQQWMVGQELTVEEALRGLTVEGAYATFEEERKGSLVAGKYADLVVLSADPLAVAPEELLDIHVLATVIGGRFEFCAPELCEGQPATPVPPSRPPIAGFSGTWTGVDEADGSSVTLTIFQTGDELTADFADSYSGQIEPPGYEGQGNGTVTSPTTAELTFHLERHDGSTVDPTATLTLSADGQQLTFLVPGSKPTELHRS